MSTLRMLCNTPISTHLVVTDSLLELLDEFRHLFGIFALIYKPSCNAFRLQFLGSLLDCFQRAGGPSKGVDGGEQPVSALQQFRASLLLRLISVNKRCIGVLLEPV